VLFRSLFLDQVQALVDEVKILKQKNPTSYQNKNASKRLAAILKLTYEVIPQDPSLGVYRQGNTLGEHRKHWLRAKFFQQYRLFFRYHEASKIIVYAWVNDEDTKRA
jgi:toxin YhaV